LADGTEPRPYFRFLWIIGQDLICFPTICLRYPLLDMPSIK